FIVADIIYNNSKLSSYLLLAAKKSNLLNDSIEKIKEEINQSKNIQLQKFKEFILNSQGESKDKLDNGLIAKLILEDLKKQFPEFNYIKELKVNIVPSIDGIQMEGIYTYPAKINDEIDVYGGILLVFDKNMELVYSKIEIPSFEKISVVSDYYSLKNPKK
ncbi:MAG: hypothetical protein ACK4GR_05965, partial [bacterium]